VLEGEALKILHVCASWRENNGAANIARMIMREQEKAGEQVSFTTWASPLALRAADEVWIHCSWMPCLWWAALWGKNSHWVPECSYDPIRRAYHGWKKSLVGPIERFFLRRADAVVATCQAEAEWIRKYEPRVKKIEVTDIKRFFDLNHEIHETHEKRQPLHLLYLGRRHPLKGVEYLEAALGGCENVKVWKYGSVEIPNKCEQGIVFRAESNVFGEGKEKVWDWCDVLVLPTLSENFGLVIAEALERGKRVITTDGAPAWGDDCKCRMDSVKCKIGDGEIWKGYGGRLIYLKGYREGTREERIALIQSAIEKFKI
jgi:glycosyltransferase involved in cell wall biosynthesis